MGKENVLVRSLRWAAIAFILAAGLEALKLVAPPSLSVRHPHVLAVLLYGIVIFLLHLRCLYTERVQRENLTAELIHNLPEMACLFDDKGSLIHWNSNIETQLGYTHQELAGIGVMGTIAEHVRDNAATAIAAISVDGKIKFESVLVAKDGTQIPCLLTGGRIIFNDRVSILGLAVDLRELRTAEQALRSSQENYRSLISSIPEVVWKTDAHGNVIFVSDQIERVLCYSASEFYERGDSIWFNSVHTDDKEMVRKAFEALIRDGTPYDLECRAQRKNGEWFWAHDRATATIDSTGTRLVTGLLSDITDRKKDEEAREMLASIVELSQDAIIARNLNGIITSWNRAAERMYGYSAAEALGQHASLLVPPEKLSELEAIVERTEDGQAIENLETQRLTKEGKIIDVSVSISAMKDARGRFAGASTIARDITLRKRAEEQLQLQSAALEAAANAILITDSEGRIVWANSAFTTLTGYSREEILGKNPRVLKSGEQPKNYYAEMWSTISSGQVWQGEIINRRKDGTIYTEDMTITPLAANAGHQTNKYYIAIKQDVTERRTLQKQLQQAQKMEAVGRLAGGVAHDFNNMLGVISGYSELLKLQGNLDEKALHYSEEIHVAAKRAASLTQQLLAFSRKQIIQPRVVELNDLVKNLGNMLRRLIGDDIELALKFSCSDSRVKVDPGQIEQVIMNLAVNSRDAMPEGGKLTIESSMCDLDESYAIHHKPVIPGRYIQLSISDTGTGMDQNTMSHIFEPFFTTKELGRGTGLGLSIVYGIVKQSGGYIWAYSELGNGTTFRLYFPFRATPAARPIIQPLIESTRGSETILLVEDDANLRSLIIEFLGGLGYNVIQCENGTAALAFTSKQAAPIHGLITDIMMPGMDGRELADRLITRFPELKVLYISGYTHDSSVQTRTLYEGEAFMQKPFSLSDLSRTLRSVLDKKSSVDRAGGDV
jgi:two-component system cell cycle sensor histidine kinase/response regulator CckA